LFRSVDGSTSSLGDVLARLSETHLLRKNNSITSNE
jgi:hypothetical protein